MLRRLAQNQHTEEQIYALPIGVELHSNTNRRNTASSTGFAGLLGHGITAWVIPLTATRAALVDTDGACVRQRDQPAHAALFCFIAPALHVHSSCHEASH